MSATKGEAHWPLVVNLVNTIIGVSVLAMPFCMRECGILLGIVLLLGSNLLTRISCHLLVKGAWLARRRSYSAYAAHVFGHSGKVVVEVMMILFLLSTLCAFYVVIGDLGPSIVAQTTGMAPDNQRMRAVVMTLIGLWVILPLSLLRSPDSLSTISSLAILFYGFFLLRMLLLAVPRLLFPSEWIREVNWWRPGGVLQCLPILTLSLSCHTQLFVTADSMAEPTPTKMDAVVTGAVNLCTAVYVGVGFLGYVVFHGIGAQLGGDVLVLFDPSGLTQLLKFGFMLSVAVSFPLMLFPCRRAIFTLLLSPKAAPGDISGDFLIPDAPFKALTFGLVALNLVLGILIPNVEFVLGLTGALIGSSVCIIFPALLFLHVAPDHQFYSRVAAQACLFVGAFMLIACTYATLHEGGEPGLEAKLPLPPQTNLSQPPVLDPAIAKAASGDVSALDKNPAAPDERQEPPLPDPAANADPPIEPRAVEPEKSAEKAADKIPEVREETRKAEAEKGHVGAAKMPPKSEEAAAILQELKEQRKEQQAIIKEQKEILSELKAEVAEKKGSKEGAPPPQLPAAGEDDAPRRPDQPKKRAAEPAAAQERSIPREEDAPKEAEKEVHPRPSTVEKAAVPQEERSADTDRI